MPALEFESGVESAWHIYPLVLDDGVDRAGFRRGLRDGRIQTSVHYPPLHLTRAFGDAPRGALTSTEDYARRTVTIPLFPHLTETQQSLVVRAIEATLCPRSQIA